MWARGDWSKGVINPSTVIRVPYRCGSWRHAGKCCQHRADIERARIKAALELRPVEEVCFAVFTLDTEKWEKQGRFKAYKQLVTCWRKLRQRLVRKLGRIEYVSVVEATRRGWPHLNVILVNAKLALQLGPPSARDDEWTPAEREVQEWLKPYLVRSKFGWVEEIQRARDVAAITRYVTKLALDAATVGEVTKLSQIPLNAPRHFRRMRSTPGFLAPRPTSEELTGEMVFAPLNETLPANVHAKGDAHADQRDGQVHVREVSAGPRGPRAR
jgi:hypothetical protein